MKTDDQLQCDVTEKLEWERHQLSEKSAVDPSFETLAKRIARAAITFQTEQTGHEPQSVSVVMSGDTLVVTLHGALSPADREMAQSSQGAEAAQKVYRRLFLARSDAFTKKIKMITGLDVRKATAELEPVSGSIVQVFTSGTTVQVFHLSGEIPTEIFDSGPRDVTAEVLQ